jgi:ADP-dependent NAD(P)H-hydrate dehydratase / NAD(P)H-hydrate epimerase
MLKKHALLTVDEMSQADRLAISGGISGAALMDAAGTAVAREITRRWSPALTVVLCGPGNNGGDGFVIARRLAEAGLKVKLALLGDRDQLTGDAAIMAGMWPGDVEDLSVAVVEGAELVVDALYGAGLSRPINGIAANVIDAVNTLKAPCIAVDMPSGVDGDTGQVLGTAPKAALTVTFFRKKPGHLLCPGRQLAGELVVADIGISGNVLNDIGPTAWENDPSLWRVVYQPPSETGHKYDRGHAVAVSGGAASTGAARLAAGSALRVGAGLVTLATPTDAVPIAAAQLTAVMVAPFADTEALNAVLSDRRMNAVLIGPGNGVGLAIRNNVLTALALKKPCVLDADALTSFEERADILFESIRSPVLCTPHEGEFARLFGKETLASGKLKAARAAARLSGSTVLLKGPDTVIAAPDGRAAINTNAPASLATAGSGDVLAGIAVGLMAQGLDPFDAGCAAAWLHGAAAQEFGFGLIAEDLIETLPAVLTKLWMDDRDG